MHKLVAALVIAAAFVVAQSDKAQAFDTVSMISIDSITAATGIRPFLAPGLPPQMVRAALRRAWVVDPSIRDFRGLQENEWDFNDPVGVPGFGQIAPDEGIKILELMASVSWTARSPGTVSADASGSTRTLALLCWLAAPLCIYPRS